MEDHKKHIKAHQSAFSRANKSLIDDMLDGIYEVFPVSNWSIELLEASDREDAKLELKKRKSPLYKAINE